MRLDPEVKRQVEAALQSPVPPPTTPEFDELLLRLRKENPELADLLESGVIFEDMPAPEEETARAVERREGLRMLKHRLLDRYDELTGEWVPSRPKQIGVGFLGLVVATTVWFALSTRETKPAQGGLPVPVAAGTTAQAQSPTSAPSTPQEAPAGQAPATDGTDAAPAQTPAPSGEAPTSTAASGSSAADSQSLPPPPSGYDAGATPPPPPPGYSASGTPAGSPGAAPPPQPLTLYVASPTSPQATAAQEGQTAPQQAAPPPQPLTLYASAGGGSQGSLSLSVARPTASNPSSSSRSPSGSVADDVAAALAGQPAQAPAGSGSGSGSLTLKRETQSTFAVQQVSGQGGQGGSFYLVGGPNPAPATAVPSPQPVAAAPAPSFPAFPAQSAGIVPPAPTAAATSTAAPPAAPYPLGTRLKGRLGVGVLIAEGSPGAVAVDAEDGSTWVGEVTLDETRRLKGRLNRVIKDGREYATSATLLDAEGTLGVAANVREEAPSIAADLIRGSLRGVSDYVSAASQAKSVTVLPGGGVAQSSQTPPLELFMAGSLANLFSLQQDKKAVVRVAQVEKGTEVLILVVPESNPQGK
jgi:hypothetical protein